MEHRSAGFWIRVAAMIIDSLLIYAFILAFSIIGQFIIGMAHSLQYFISLLTVFLLLFGPITYIALMPISKYQATYGKYILGLKITNDNGEQISAGQSWIRALSSILSFLTLLMGYIMVAFTLKNRGLHDILAKTYVVKGNKQNIQAQRKLKF